jgi:hypothetical protein
MSTNKDLLKQAIAEAKTIREAAIANAKEALEETLTPHLKEMLAQKLQEMEDSDEEEDNVDYTMGRHNDPDQLPNPPAQLNIPEGEEEGEEEETEEGEEEEEVEIEDMSIDDLKDLIRDIVSQEVGHDESEEEMPGEEAPEGEEDMVSMDGDSEEIDINELLAELAEEEKMEEGKLGDFVKKVGDKVKATVGTGGKMDQFIDRTHAKMKKAGVASPYGGQKVFEESEELDEYGSSTMREPSDSAAAGLDNIISGLKKLVAKGGPIAAKAKAALEDLGSAAGAAMRAEATELYEYETGKMREPSDSAASGLDNIISGLKKLVAYGGPIAAKAKAALEVLGSAAGAAMRAEATELNEALATVRQLRNQLQEVNLLNAKLLYVNKVFKANNLTEGQKVNVVAAFDKAETVKEVKLVFETVSKNVVTKPATIKEHRSFASKATGNAQTTAPKEIISEVSEQVSRWQKLAGIIK